MGDERSFTMMARPPASDGMLIKFLERTRTGPPVRVDNESVAEASRLIR